MTGPSNCQREGLTQGGFAAPVWFPPTIATTAAAAPPHHRSYKPQLDTTTTNTIITIVLFILIITTTTSIIIMPTAIIAGAVTARAATDRSVKTMKLGTLHAPTARFYEASCVACTSSTPVMFDNSGTGWKRVEVRWS